MNYYQTPFEGNCRGTLTFGAMEITEGKEPPMYLAARNQRLLNGSEAFLNFHKEIKLSGQTYQLGMLSIYERSRLHFTSLHHVNNKFVYYDRTITSKKKLRRATMPADYMQDTIYLDHALYVKTFNKIKFKICKYKTTSLIYSQNDINS